MPSGIAPSACLRGGLVPGLVGSQTISFSAPSLQPVAGLLPYRRTGCKDGKRQERFLPPTYTLVLMWIATQAHVRQQARENCAARHRQKNVRRGGSLQVRAALSWPCLPTRPAWSWRFISTVPPRKRPATSQTTHPRGPGQHFLSLRCRPRPPHAPFRRRAGPTTNSQRWTSSTKTLNIHARIRRDFFELPSSG